jgi:hypothetical protein
MADERRAALYDKQNPGNGISLLGFLIRVS